MRERFNTKKNGYLGWESRAREKRKADPSRLKPARDDKIRRSAARLRPCLDTKRKHESFSAYEVVSERK